MKASCRVCGAVLIYAGKGRPRTVCSECRPPGSPEPSGLLRGLVRARRARRQAWNAARSAAYRRVAADHPDEYHAALREEWRARYPR